jgi:hypothetical protein
MVKGSIMVFRSRLVGVFAVILISLFQNLSFAQSRSGTPSDPFEVIDEPMHSLRMNNATIRVYEANIPGNSATLFHRHSFSGVGIDMTPVRLSVEKLGAATQEETTKSGDFFPVKGSPPYVHRVINGDNAPYRAIVAERLSHSPLNAGASTLSGIPVYKLEVESDLVLAFRLTLRRGESTNSHTVRSNTLVVAVSGGLVSIEQAGQPRKLRAVAPGELEWISDSRSMTISNLGVSDYVAAFFEWK